MKKIIILFILIFLVSFCFVSCNSTKYNEALELIENGEYVAAYEILDELGDYKDAQQKIENFHYVPVRATYSEEDEIEYVEFFYNKDNLPIQVVHTDSDGDKSIRDYTYDANGNVIKKVYTDSDRDTDSVDFEYKLVYIPCGATEWIEEMLDTYY